MNYRKKVLITGVKGMLGSALKQNLSHKYQCIGIDIEDADITIEEQIKEEILSIEPDIVIHTAAFTNVDNCEQHKELSHKINATGTENVAHAAKLADAKLIFISTDYVFDGSKRTPYTEKDTPSPLSTYGKDKLEAEGYVQEICKNHLIIRTSWLYGPYGKNFVTKIISLSKRNPELKIVDDQVGSPTYTIDLAEAINKLLDIDATGIVHVSNSGQCNWHEFTKTIFELTGNQTPILPIKSNEFNAPAKRPKYSVLDTSKYNKLAQNKLRSWGEALKSYLTNT